VSLLCELVSPPGVLERLPRMLVSGLVFPFFVVRSRSAVSMRGKIVVFSSFLVRCVHLKSSIAASTAKWQFENNKHSFRIEMLASNIHK